MKALVTGATGFIGSAVTLELLKAGMTVRVLVRENSDTTGINGLDVDVVVGDIRDFESMQSALSGCAVLYHLAALVAKWAPNTTEFYDANVEGTRTVLKAALKMGTERVVHTSSIVTIGFHGPACLGTESSQFNLWHTGDHYTRSKYLAELEALSICRKGLPLVVVNPTNVIGVGDIKPTANGRMIVDFLMRKKPVYVDRGVNIVDVEDVARGHILAGQKGKVGERYILGNQNMTLREFFRLLAEVSGVDPPRFRIPHACALVAAHASQSLARVAATRPRHTVSSVRMASSLAYFDVSKAVNELGLTLTPVRTTLEKVVRWFRQNGYVNS
jgi:dihydroflavonol-4-reductase